MLAEILGPDLLIILGIVVLLFGGSQLPKLARSLGSAKAEFEKGTREGQGGEPEPAPPAAPVADEQVTMTRAELDRLIAEREARGRGEASAAS
ncbi:MAG: twin-arginine translocase TatA/TatE family subunit [Acidimicrobiia bacterium]|nr:twin-arginine translocase TatA/TatE family subunit [Acidimicrobiia bacterium]